jgi:hypothetical protein
MDERLDLNTRTNIERADAFWAVEFVARHGQEIDTEFSHLRRDLSHGLGRIGMEKNSVLPRNPADLCNWLNGPDFVVGVHHGNQDRV